MKYSIEKGRVTKTMSRVVAYNFVGRTVRLLYRPDSLPRVIALN